MPRWAYALLTCCWLGAALGCWAVGVRASASSWLSNAWVFSMFVCGLIAPVMVGRAATWGLARRFFWRKPPASI